ncbi:hypothetical protein CLAFUW4_08353 [Fulvia fulva]|uniref:Uncharacterized protein n=1 Tax=Passalora fulva TaxID=5499 RepID=A0A9Q8LC77_PASFU|nr:uncharacterized protein CLAFUR5_08459 [Fulvia fulva]KAK4629491.1 hypothetical protein CLAFUR4_08358 [Fulvia fulva]KAK4630355.1 hypothetical protein CLAFUR0_08353 [Fulvia fulva]UJO14695.1 hypothetical protein CLAFUR5_08459 [Fulvia fulva]WPV12688.1 hypothetical protein CLAFUW4_08353 [Fulvia fulva]WPV27996.1 hypothetical protein CLAFUW7_08353 [Fulvia fulva]
MTKRPEQSNNVKPIFLPVVKLEVQSVGIGIVRISRSVDTLSTVEIQTSCIRIEHCAGGGGLTCQFCANGKQPRQTVKKARDVAVLAFEFAGLTWLSYASASRCRGSAVDVEAYAPPRQRGSLKKLLSC